MAKVSKSLQRKWIHALESGKYTQGHNTLRTQNDEFCCLGVLCDVVSPKGWNNENNCFDYDGSSISLTNPVKAKVGLLEDSEDSWYSYTSALMKMNDEDNSDFIDIANTLRMYFDIWD